MSFDYPQKVLFKHCDPAGLVFYPRYFEMINDVVESFFDDALGIPFEKLHETANIPTVHLDTTFNTPSRHGDRLIITLTVLRIGNSAIDLSIIARSGTEIRFSAKSTLVYVDKSGKPARLSDTLRTALTPHLKDTPDAS